MQDETYTGTLVQGKQGTPHYKIKQMEQRPASEWVRVPDAHEALIARQDFELVQRIKGLDTRTSPNEDTVYLFSGILICGCCGSRMTRKINRANGKEYHYYCRHSEADEESRCHKMRLNAAELEQAVFLTLKKQMEAAAPLAPDGTLRVDASVPERTEYEQQIEVLQDGKRILYERYLIGEIDLNTYKAEKAACDELLLKTKNAYAAVLAQAKQKQDEQARQDSRKEASEAIFDADTLTTELAELLIDRVLVYPNMRIEIAYKIQDIFD